MTWMPVSGFSSDAFDYSRLFASVLIAALTARASLSAYSEFRREWRPGVECTIDDRELCRTGFTVYLIALGQAANHAACGFARQGFIQNISVLL